MYLIGDYAGDLLGSGAAGEETNNILNTRNKTFRFINTDSFNDVWSNRLSEARRLSAWSHGCQIYLRGTRERLVYLKYVYVTASMLRAQRPKIKKYKIKRLKVFSAECCSVWDKSCLMLGDLRNIYIFINHQLGLVQRRVRKEGARPFINQYKDFKSILKDTGLCYLV